MWQRGGSVLKLYALPVHMVVPTALGPQLKPMDFLIMFCSLRLYNEQTE